MALARLSCAGVWLRTSACLGSRRLPACPSPRCLSGGGDAIPKQSKEGGERGGGGGGGIRPYLELMRVEKPIGTWLLFLPSTWSIAAASAPALPSPSLLCLFAGGAWLMRGAGCVINDLWDRDLDRRVARTRQRPLASGAVSPRGALILLSGLLSASLAILLQLNWLSVGLGLISILPVAAYPLAKRVTNWPQAVLGLTINWGALVGWTAVSGSVAPAPMAAFYSAGLCWTLLYDTIYAHQDKRDDVAAGVKSSALALGDAWSKPALCLFAAGMLGSLTAAGKAAELGDLYFLGLPFVAVALAQIIRGVDLSSPASCAAAFRANRNVGILVLAAVLLGAISATPHKETSLRLL